MISTLLRYVTYPRNRLPRTIGILATLFTLLLCIAAHARISSEDLTAIYETGLIPLTDDQEGVYKAGRDYLIIETMRVKRGDTVEFAPGTRLFFHTSAKMTVHGVLRFKGTPEEPVTIGKLNVTIPKLSRKVEMQFDSVSFYVYRNASLVMDNVKLVDSTISFRGTDSTSEFTFDSVRCSGNRFSLPDTVLNFWPGSCVTCARQNGNLTHPCVLPPPPDTKTIVVKKTLGWSTFKIPVRITLGAGVLAAAAVWYYHNDKALDADKKYDSYVNSTPTNSDNAKRELDTYKQASKIALRYRDLASYAAACGAASLTLTFVLGGNAK